MYNEYASFGCAILREASKPMAERMSKAFEWIAKNTDEKALESLSRSVRIMEEGFKKKKPCPYTDAFFDMMEKEMQKQFERDMIYYTICYDGFRL